MKQGSTFYAHDQVKYDRVTSVLSLMTNANALINWARRQTIDAAATVSQHDTPDRSVWKDEVYAQAKIYMEAKRNLGSNVHAAIDAWFAGEQVSERYQLYIDNAEKVMKEAKVKDGRHELTVVNTDLQYAGTVDLWSPKTIIDWKTGSLYAQHLVQMWAYMNASHYYDDTEDRLVEIGTRPTLGIVAHIDEEGYHTEILTANSPLYDACQDTFEACRTVKRFDTIYKER